MKHLSRLIATTVAVVQIGLAGILCAVPARAEGFSLSDYGARGTSLAGGMIGRADDASAVAWNPAGITQIPGMTTMFGGTFIAPTGKVGTIGNGISASTTVDKHIWANPHGYLTWQYTDSLWLGVGIFSRFGLGNSYPGDWPGRRNLVDVSLQTVSFNPSVAWKVNEHLSLAAGVELMGASMEMHKDNPYLSATGLGNLRQKLGGKGAALGFNLAAHYIFTDQWAAGLTYRSRVQQNVSGRSTFDRNTKAVSLPSLGVSIPAYVDSDLHGTLTLPDVISLGVVWRPTTDLSLEAGTVYTVWSAFSSLNIYLENPMNYAAMSNKAWHDTWTFNLSAEYRALDWLTLRGGYIYETGAINLSNADYMTPSNGRHRITAGVGFNWDQWTLDLAYGYLIIKDLGYNESAKHGTSGVLPGSGHNGRAHIAAVSVGYTF